MGFAPGVRVGPYEIVSALGAGGMGEVYKATDTRLGRAVAIKILPSADPDLIARFDREARAVAALAHPHICALYDVGSAPRQDAAAGDAAIRYLVMELLDAVLRRRTAPLTERSMACVHVERVGPPRSLRALVSCGRHQAARVDVRRASTGLAERRPRAVLSNRRRRDHGGWS